MKIFLTGGDNYGWATATDYMVAEYSWSKFAELTDDYNEADAIHSVVWYKLAEIPKEILKDKVVIANISHDVRAMFTMPELLSVAPYIDLWIAPSQRAKGTLDDLGLPSFYIPYGFDEDCFFEMSQDEKEGIYEKYNVPKNKFIIGSFQRDTEGKDLKTPKYVKGPDILFELIKSTYQKHTNLFVLLAGPRRFWLRKQLDAANIPYKYIGKDVPEGEDDNDLNILSHEEINELYNISDLIIVSSRMEGAPHAIMESISTATDIIATDVGISPELLSGDQIFRNFPQGRDLLDRLLTNNQPTELKLANKESLKNNLKENIVTYYDKLSTILDEKKIEDSRRIVFKEVKPVKKDSKGGILQKLLGSNKDFSIWFEFKDGPWGGGNQFLKALKKQAENIGFNVGTNGKSNSILINSFHIESDEIKTIKWADKHLVHRIDGPTNLIREEGKERDRAMFKLNRKYVDVTVFQSAWSFIQNVKEGFSMVNPLLITNAPDPEFFYKQDNKSLNPRDKVKIVSTSWSDNPRKGKAVYEWLDKNIDFDKYEYTFYGRVQSEFDNIIVKEPISSAELAEELRRQDIYITASKNDPCSNALIEALICGLPAIYLESGGHSEITGFGGLGFKSQEEIPKLLDELVENYDAIRNLIYRPSIEEVTDQYISILNTEI